MRHRKPIVYDESTNPSNGWRSPDPDDDPAAELRLSAAFEREMLALGDDTVIEETEDDIQAATDYGYDRYAKGGN